MKGKILLISGYTAFFIPAFLCSLYLTFNPVPIKAWLENQARQKGYNLTISNLDKYRLSGIQAKEITWQNAQGRTIKIDQIKARLSLLPLLLGRKQIGFQMKISGGKVSGKVEQAKRGFQTEFDLQEVNLANMQAGPQGGFWVAAKLSGKGNLNLTPRENPKAWTGKIEGQLSPGTIPSFAYQGFQVPEIKIEQGQFNLELNNGSAQIKTFELKSPDFPFSGTGQVELRNPIASSLLKLEAKIKPSQAFLEQIKMLESIIPPNHTITYNGTLGGIVSGH